MILVKKMVKRKPTADPKVYGLMSKDAYQSNAEIHEKELRKHGFRLDSDLSDKETKVFVNDTTHKVVVSYRGTKASKDIVSDLAIATGTESLNPRFKGALKKFDQVHTKYGKEYSYDTTGHSLGGQLATYVNRHRPHQVDENLSYSRGSGVGELFRQRPHNTYDYSNSKDIVSLGARLNSDKPWYVRLYNLVTKPPAQIAAEALYRNFKGSERNFVQNEMDKNPIEAHSIDLEWL